MITPIHICHISQSAGGVETYLRNLLRYCDGNRFRHTVICYTNGTLTRTAKDAGAHVIMIPMVGEISPWKDLISLIRVLSVVYRLKPDIIHAHSAKGGMWGRLCGLILGIPVDFTPHGFSYLGQQGLHRSFVLWIEKMLAQTPSMLIASSPSEAKRAINEVGWPPHKVTSVFPNSIEVKEEKVYHSQKEYISVLAVGLLVYAKNYEMFIRVANIVKRRGKSIRFTIRGYCGYDREMNVRERLVQMIRDFDLSEVVYIEPWTEPGVVEREMLSSDIYISTSRYESFGFAVAEAMEKSLPIVATKIDGSIDLVEDGKSGYLVDVNDDERMASYICDLASNSHLRNQMGQTGRQRLVELFNIRKNISAIESIYSMQSTG